MITLSNIDRCLDYIPFVSTATNLAALFYQKLLIPSFERKKIPVYTYLKNKSYARCVTLLVPVIGNLIVLAGDLGKLKNFHTGLEAWRKDPASAGNKEEAIRRLRYAGLFGAAGLNLSGLGLNTLPRQIWQLTQLRTLNLARNQLSELPPEIAQLTELKTLELQTNHLRSIPKLPDLNTLYLYDNELTSLEIGQELKILAAGNNRLTAFPVHTGLQELYLDRNSISEIPKEIGSMTRLTQLAMGRNGLTALPQELGQLTQLEGLGVEENPLSALPETLGSLAKLQSLRAAISAAPILSACRRLREAEIAQALPARLAQRKISVDIEPLTEKQKVLLSNYLDKSSLLILSGSVSDILSDVVKHASFRDWFFNHLDREEVEAARKIICAPEPLSSPEKVKILTAAAKRIRLYKEIGKVNRQNRVDKDSDEIYLYYEQRLKKRLQLDLQTTYKGRGARIWINEEQIVKDVNEHYLEELYSMPLYQEEHI